MKELVKKASALNLDDLIWKPLYPNNMPCNGLDGYYCLILHKGNEDKICGRKYTIFFQYKEIEEGTGHINRKEIDRYVLFEKNYFNIKGPTKHPEPSDDFDWYVESSDTLHATEVNDYGSFVYAYEDLDSARKRVLNQYKAVYAYALSHLI